MYVRRIGGKKSEVGNVYDVILKHAGLLELLPTIINCRQGKLIATTLYPPEELLLNVTEVSKAAGRLGCVCYLQD